MARAIHLTRLALLLALGLLTVLLVRFHTLDSVLPASTGGAPTVALARLPTVTRMPVYDEAFLDSLRRDPDLDRMVQRAENAGLEVFISGSPRSPSYNVVDPVSGKTVLYLSVEYARAGR